MTQHVNRGAPRPLASKAIELLVSEGHRVAVAESLTGGLLVSALIDVPGASAAVSGGVVAYQTALKSSVLGVAPELLAAHGAVHPDVAAQMAQGVRATLNGGGSSPQVGVSTTGVAGPDPQDGQSVGTVFIAVSCGATTEVREHHFLGHRAEIREASVIAALELLIEVLGAPGID